MIFGKVDNPLEIDFTLPPDHSGTQKVLSKHAAAEPFKIYVGCAKWNKTDLKNFYPKGIKDELAYYATQFNCIELNATFYQAPTKEQVLTWKAKTPPDFVFFPKLPNTVSHYKRLLNVKTIADDFCLSVSAFEQQLGMVFLQMHDNFNPKNMDRVEKFIQEFPPEIRLAVEVRNKDWFLNKESFNRYTKLLEDNRITNIIVDTAGRRDMLHMRLTTPYAFIRFVGANFDGDYARLDAWVERLTEWKNQGLKELYFFVHQNVELSSPVFAYYFIQKVNKALGINLKRPTLLQ